VLSDNDFSRALNVEQQRSSYIEQAQKLYFATGENIMKNKIVSILCLCSFLLLTACNTMSGAGKDIQKGGEALENSADKNKSY
jgi:entericidin B